MFGSNLSKKQLVILMPIFILSISFLGAFSYNNGIFYHEIDSYVLPTISLQYRGSILMNEADLVKARRDFPGLYKNVNSFDDLRSAKLLVTKSGKWESFYFPVLAIGALPFKLLLALMQANQECCFILFNLFCVAYLEIQILINNKFSLRQKIIGLALINCSPLFLYVRYIGAETMIFSLAAIGVLRIYEHKYKRAAAAITVAGLANSTVMVLGLACIVDFTVFTLKKHKGQGILGIVWQEVKNIFLLALCFIPSFFPFIFKHATGVRSFESGAKTGGAFSRCLAYIFDMNLGFCSFCPILVFLLIFLFFGNIKKKSFRIFVFYFGLLGTMLAYSLMPHINCGMIYCSRYVFWSYGMLFMIILLFLFDLFETSMGKKIITIIIALSCGISCACFYLNKATFLYYLDFHKTAKMILSHAPSLYNPLPSTFYSRTKHVDGGYNYKTPIIYIGENGYVSKIFCSNKDVPDLENVSTIDGRKLVFRANEDDVPRYISIPSYKKFIRFNDYNLYDEIYFYGDYYNLNNYNVTGVWWKEQNFTWTKGKNFILPLRFNEIELGKDIRVSVEVGAIFNNKQRVLIYVNDNFITEVYNPQPLLNFNFQLKNPFAIIRFYFPDACTPNSVNGSQDYRSLALGLRKISLTDSSSEQIIYPSLSVNEPIFFDNIANNSSAYNIIGLSHSEEHFTWTDGGFLLMQACLQNFDNARPVHAVIDCNVFNGVQRVNVAVNDSNRLRLTVKQGSALEFDFMPPQDGKLTLEFEFPDAVSPKKLGLSEDSRDLALALKSIVFTQNH